MKEKGEYEQKFYSSKFLSSIKLAVHIFSLRSYAAKYINLKFRINLKDKEINESRQYNGASKKNRHDLDTNTNQ